MLKVGGLFSKLVRDGLMGLIFLAICDFFGSLIISLPVWLFTGNNFPSIFRITFLVLILAEITALTLISFVALSRYPQYGRMYSEYVKEGRTKEAADKRAKEKVRYRILFDAEEGLIQKNIVRGFLYKLLHLPV